MELKQHVMFISSPRKRDPAPRIGTHMAQAIAWLNDGYWTGLDLRLAWKFLGFTETPLPWHGFERIRTAILDMPLVGGVFAGAMVAYVAGMLSMVAAELESDKRKG
jgi:hypothetical protein